jgi:FlaA1/EpsC-like NDP-sugar epimerase
MYQNIGQASAKRHYAYYRRVLSSILLDTVIFVASYAITFSARAVTSRLIADESIGPILLNTLMMIVMLYLFGVYQRMWTRTSGHEARIIIYAFVLNTIVFGAFNLLLEPRPLPNSVVLVGNLLALGAMIAVRYRSRLISGVEWRWQVLWRGEIPKTKTRVLIVGAGESGQALVWRLRHRFANQEYVIVGFIDDDPDKQDMYIEGARVLGTRRDIMRIVDAYRVDLITVAMHNVSGADFREIIAECEKTKALIKVVPDILAAVQNQSHAVLLRDVQIEDLIGRSVISRQEGIDLSLVSNRVVLVTGAAGSIGSELSRQVMLTDPKRVILLDNNESGLHDLLTELKARFPNIDVVPALVDVSLESGVRRMFEKHRPQLVFHAAAYKHVPMLEYYPTEALRVNICGTYNLAKLASEYLVERFVLISTDKAVNPSSIMGATKRVCELVVHMMSQQPENTTLYTAVRFGNVLGSRGSVVPTFNRQIDSGGPVTVTHKEMMRYFMSIPEAVNLIIHAACLTEGDDIFILRMGEEVRILELAERMIRMRGLRPYIDIDIRITGVRPGEKLNEELYTQTETPQLTLHPNIIRLNQWETRYTPAAFWEEIHRLTQTDSVDADQALQQLQALTQHNTPYAISAD